jgi:beta-xylosidase
MRDLSPRPETPTERANALLTQMNLAEKAAQVSAVMPHTMLGATGLDDGAMRRIMGDGVGHISNLGFIAPGPVQAAGLTNAIQRFLVEETRLGIPAMVHAEALNGLVIPGFTSFPTPIGLAATWDPDAVKAMADLIRRQMRSVGVRHALSPVLDVARDARWGRVHETYGEDVYLVSAMSVAFVGGLQGADLTDGVIATGKHFLGYSLTEAGQNLAATQLGMRELYDVYATPFEAAIHLAGMRSVMNSYSEVDGVPVAANRALLTDLLRGRMGFEGSVVADYSAVEHLHTRQGVADSLAEAGVLALSAGLDIELPAVSGYGENLVQAVTEGRLDEGILDEAVRRALVDKILVGLLDDPYVAMDPESITLLAGEGADLSERLAAESVTLLKNDGILPLQRGRKIAVLGPNAELAIVSFAAYSVPAQVDMMKGMATGESRMAGVESLMDAPADQLADRQARMAGLSGEQTARDDYGALGLVDAIRAVDPTADVSSVEGVTIHPGGPRDIDTAVQAAAEADVAILAIGGRAGWFGTKITEGEGTDAARIELSTDQIDLIRAVAATKTPLVGVVFQGRPHAIAEVDDLFSAVLVAYYGGPFGTQAVADAVFGEQEPTGRLPHSMPRATGQVPLYYSQHRGSGYRRTPADGFRGYIDLNDVTPLYPFGHGLGYTTFDLGELELDRTNAPADGGAVALTIKVTNTGEHEGTAVVQFYASDTAVGIVRPELQLVGFTRHRLAPGASATVRCKLELSQLGYSGIDGGFVLEPGPIEFSAGLSSSDLRSRAMLEVTGPTADLEGRRSYLSRSTTSPSAS